MKKIEKKINTYSEANKLVRNWLIFLPLISELKSNAMDVDDDRHWKNFREKLNTDLEVDEGTSLETFWDLDLYTKQKQELVEEITERAKQEEKISSALDVIEAKWKEVTFIRTKLELKNGTIETVKMDPDEVEILEDHQL